MARIYRFVDDPPQLFFWSIDEITIFGVFFVMGLLGNFLLYGMATGFASAYLFSKFKSTRSEGYLQHFFYWLGLFRIKKSVPSYMRFFFE